MAERLEEMRLPQSDAAVDEERIVKRRRILAHCDRGRVGHPIRRPSDEILERVGGIEYEVGLRRRRRRGRGGGGADRRREGDRRRAAHLKDDLRHAAEERLKRVLERLWGEFFRAGAVERIRRRNEDGVFADGLELELAAPRPVDLRVKLRLEKREDLLLLGDGDRRHLGILSRIEAKIGLERNAPTTTTPIRSAR